MHLKVVLLANYTRGGGLQWRQTRNAITLDFWDANNTHTANASLLHTASLHRRQLSREAVHGSSTTGKGAHKCLKMVWDSVQVSKKEHFTNSTAPGAGHINGAMRGFMHNNDPTRLGLLFHPHPARARV